MKIGITCYPTYGGSGVIAAELGKFLARQGYEVYFIASALPFRLEHFDGKFFFYEVDVSSYPLFDYHQSYSLHLTAKMCEVITYHKLDILHVHYAIPHSISAILAKEITGLPVAVVTTLHGTDITIVGSEPAFLPVTRFGIDKSDGVTAVSHHLRSETIDMFSVSKEIEVIYNFVDTHVFTQKPNNALRKKIAPNNEKIIIHISNFRPIKRVECVVKIFSEVLRKIPAKLVLIGDGPDRGKAEKLCRDLGISNYTLFLGKQSDIQDFLSVSDLVLSASLIESFGLSILEAMSCGVPVVAPRVGGIPEVVQDGRQGFLIEPDDFDGYSTAIVEILRNTNLHQAMSKSGRERAQNYFDTRLIVPQYIQLYQKMLKKE